MRCLECAVGKCEDCRTLGFCCECCGRDELFEEEEDE